MKVQEVLTIGRKIGPENFSKYRQFIRSIKNPAIESASTHLNLQGVNIMDTLKLKGLDTEAFPEVRKIFKALHKMNLVGKSAGERYGAD